MPRGYPGTRTCPNCQNSIFAEEAAFCEICGTPVPDAKVRRKVEKNLGGQPSGAISSVATDKKEDKTAGGG